MPHPFIDAAVEGSTDEAVVERLIDHAGGKVGTVYGKKGKSHLCQKIAGYNNAALRAPWLVLVDLDADADCAPPLCETWLPQPAPHLCFRVAVRAASRFRDAKAMIPRACKRLAEVDFPIAAVSRHAAREKSIRHGHPSTLHLWWARRPRAPSRAVLLALLLPDPCDPHCPEAFKKTARQILLAMHGRPQGWAAAVGTDEGLRRIVLKFIADFANWDNAAHRPYLDAGRALVKAAHGEEAPLVVDPFAGGGSIPLEALRLGCEAFASDLNPVACLILKVMLEDIPRYGPGLAGELRRAGAAIRNAAARELTELYPRDPDGAMPIAYLGARTVRCEAPDCGAEIPLMRSFWLARKPKRKRALRCRAERLEGGPPRVVFEVFEPKAPAGTVARARATCLCCRAVLPPERVRAQLSEQRGDSDAVFDDAGRRGGGARLTAVVTLKPGETGRHYRLPTDADYAAEARAHNGLAGALEEDARPTALFLRTLQSTEASEGNGEEGEDDEEAVARATARGFSLPFDVVRRFSQPIGIDLDRWTGRVIGQEKGMVRLLPVAERAKALFGADGAGAATGWIEADPAEGLQRTLFPELDAAPKPPPRRRAGRIGAEGDAGLRSLEATALDRVHAAMLLQAGGHANALRALIAAEQDRGPDFLRLANALSALYPRGSREKRLLDAMLLAAPR